jgi:hypothetical protein
VQGTAAGLLDGLRRELVAGQPVHVGETLETGRASRLRIVFEDTSAITLGAEARLVVQALERGTRQDAGRQWLGILAGTFRFVTGAIGQAEPNAVELRTPVATIGIRGTELFGGPLAAGMPPGELHYGVQLFAGEIAVITPYGTVTLDRPGQGTFLPMAGDRAPTTPALWGAAATREAAESVAFSQGGSE